MTVTPTPEQFLAQSDPDEEELDPPAFDEQFLAQLVGSPFDWPNGPLESIAASLRTIAGSVDGQHEAVLEETREERDDWEAKHHVLFQLVEELESIIKPSTSKLANTVREAIGRWRGIPAADPEDAGSAPAAPELVTVPVSSAVEMGHEPPSNDAPIEQWVAYAQSLGHDIDPGRTNRSQIRTLLGLPHGPAEGGAS